MHGWIILDKPSGITSAHAVAKVKRLFSSPLEGGGRVGGDARLRVASSAPTLALPLPLKGEGKLKIGHAGTLDPLASGVLPLALGEATKTIPYMMAADKAYEFTVTWGEERDTDDCEGRVIRTSDKRPAPEEIEAILPRFIGAIRQVPPAYSAIKLAGERAYDLARAGEPVALKAREVHIYSLSLREQEPSPFGRGQDEGGAAREMLNMEQCPHPALRATFSRREKENFLCHCSKGTYIRALARDMGRELGCLGHISRLRRLKVGKFMENHTISLAQMEESVYKGDLGFLHPVTAALDDILAVEVTEPQAVLLRRGQNVVFPSVETPVLLARCQGKAVALCEGKAGRLKPVRVFNLVATGH